VVFAIRALSRDAAFSCAGRNALTKPPTSSHGRIQPSRAWISRLPARTALGRSESVAIPAV